MATSFFPLHSTCAILEETIGLNMDVLLQQRQANKTGNHVWNSFMYRTHDLVNGALKEAKEGTGIAIHAAEYAIEQPINVVKGWGAEIKQTVVEARNTMVHLALLGMFGYFAWEFVSNEQIMSRTASWVNGLTRTNKRRRINY